MIREQNPEECDVRPAELFGRATEAKSRHCSRAPNRKTLFFKARFPGY